MNTQDAQARPSRPVLGHRRGRALVIDGDAWIGWVIVDVLAGEGFTVEQAADGSTGLCLAAQLQPLARCAAASLASCQSRWPEAVAASRRRPLEAPSRDLPPLLMRVRCRSPVDRIGGGTGVSVGLVVSVRTYRVCAGA